MVPSLQRFCNINVFNGLPAARCLVPNQYIHTQHKYLPRTHTQQSYSHTHTPRTPSPNSPCVKHTIYVYIVSELKTNCASCTHSTRTRQKSKRAKLTITHLYTNSILLTSQIYVHNTCIPHAYSIYTTKT